jgi:hypothetical protein
VTFEILNRSLVRLGRFAGSEGPKIAPFASLGILLARVQAILAGHQFSNHRIPRIFFGASEPGQIIPQHGCVPALPASLSPGRENFSGKNTKVVRAAENQASVIIRRGLEVKQQLFASGRGRNIFLTFPFIEQAMSQACAFASPFPGILSVMIFQ